MGRTYRNKDKRTKKFLKESRKNRQAKRSLSYAETRCQPSDRKEEFDNDAKEGCNS